MTARDFLEMTKHAELRDLAEKLWRERDELRVRVAELEAVCKEVHAAWMRVDPVNPTDAALLEPMHRLEHVLAFGSASPDAGEESKS